MQDDCRQSFSAVIRNSLHINLYILSAVRCPSVLTSVTVGVANSVADGVTMRMTWLMEMAIDDMWPRVSRECCAVREHQLLQSIVLFLLYCRFLSE